MISGEEMDDTEFRFESVVMRLVQSPEEVIAELQSLVDAAADIDSYKAALKKSDFMTGECEVRAKNALETFQALMLTESISEGRNRGSRKQSPKDDVDDTISKWFCGLTFRALLGGDELKRRTVSRAWTEVVRLSEKFPSQGDDFRAAWNSFVLIPLDLMAVATKISVPHALTEEDDDEDALSWNTVSREYDELLAKSRHGFLNVEQVIQDTPRKEISPAFNSAFELFRRDLLSPELSEDDAVGLFHGLSVPAHEQENVRKIDRDAVHKHLRVARGNSPKSFREFQRLWNTAVLDEAQEARGLVEADGFSILRDKDIFQDAPHGIDAIAPHLAGPFENVMRKALVEHSQITDPRLASLGLDTPLAIVAEQAAYDWVQESDIGKEMITQGKENQRVVQAAKEKLRRLYQGLDDSHQKDYKRIRREISKAERCISSGEIGDALTAMRRSSESLLYQMARRRRVHITKSRGPFAVRIDSARKRRAISVEEAEKFHELRKATNPGAHEMMVGLRPAQNVHIALDLFVSLCGIGLLGWTE